LAVGRCRGSVDDVPTKRMVGTLTVQGQLTVVVTPLVVTEIDDFRAWSPGPARQSERLNRMPSRGAVGPAIVVHSEENADAYGDGK